MKQVAVTFRLSGDDRSRRFLGMAGEAFSLSPPPLSLPSGAFQELREPTLQRAFALEVVEMNEARQTLGSGPLGGGSRKPASSVARCGADRVACCILGDVRWRMSVKALVHLI